MPTCKPYFVRVAIVLICTVTMLRLFSLNNQLAYRETTSKICSRRLGRINALQAPLINRIHRVVLISLCHSADRRDDFSRLAPLSSLGVG